MKVRAKVAVVVVVAAVVAVGGKLSTRPHSPQQGPFHLSFRFCPFCSISFWRPFIISLISCGSIHYISHFLFGHSVSFLFGGRIHYISHFYLSCLICPCCFISFWPIHDLSCLVGAFDLMSYLIASFKESRYPGAGGVQLATALVGFWRDQVRACKKPVPHAYPCTCTCTCTCTYAYSRTKYA
jgi:hypothetical protein